MLLVYQTGSVKIGEVVRYTVTYTPSRDRILPSPELLHLRIKNTTSAALRAAFVHGPYTLSVAAYPAHFNPNEKFENPRRYGVPEFEPMLKAGGNWTCQLVVPDNIRQSAGTGPGPAGPVFGATEGAAPGDEQEELSVSWVVEIASQVVFSASAAVNYEILVARDEKSLDVGSGSVVPVVGNQVQIPQPGRVSDFQQQVVAAAQDAAGAVPHRQHHQKGVFSRAMQLKVEDTAALWNKPELPGWDEAGWLRAKMSGATMPAEAVATDAQSAGVPIPLPKRQKKVHLVVVTHGLHSNLGADMLFLKESIDAGVKQAKIDARERRRRERAEKREKEEERRKVEAEAAATDDDASRDAEQPPARENEAEESEEEDGDDEEVIVRGYSGNATKTEKGIKYLGKRLARYILSMTYPDQPFLPTAKAASEAIAHTLKASSQNLDAEGKPAHKHSTIHKASSVDGKRLYKITKISFIAHSLGGLVQTYAIAYIQQHSPQFFDLIEPVNFIAMASPFLGLNHENPLYVKFALDFGLVGRTGQDLGLTWRAPTLARSGWGAIVSNLGENAHKRVYGDSQPESKPLLRILPVGPAHTALKKFRNRTVYSNVVNDGIVPLRTSCLLFLDWQGLGRVEKARREAGLVETVVGFVSAELTGTNMLSPRRAPWTSNEGSEDSDKNGKSSPSPDGGSHEVPQPPTNAIQEDDRQSLRSAPFPQPGEHSDDFPFSSTTNNANPFSGFFSLFRNNDPPKSPQLPSSKQTKIYQRSQTLKIGDDGSDSGASTKSKVTSGNELTEDHEGAFAPPTTTFFESAGDLLNPKLPSVEYLIDPSKRPRTIFHDRIYHPEDIPRPPVKKRTTGLSVRRKSFPRAGAISNASTPKESPITSPELNARDAYFSPMIGSSKDANASTAYNDHHEGTDSEAAVEVVDTSQMRVEEKIARAYHRDLSWRKVLVKLEPDAHNNMIVRRIFANAFGWPVIHHLVEAHFSDSVAARTRDDEEEGTERARNPAEPPDEHGAETKEDKDQQVRYSGDAAHDEEAVPSGIVAGLQGARAGPGSRTQSGEIDVAAGRAKSPLGYSGLGITLSSSPPSLNANAGEGPQQKQKHPRPGWERLDSVAWSEHDWLDSDEEEEDSGRRRSLGTRREHMLAVTGTASDRAASPLSPGFGAGLTGWNWTEKIVGKGVASRPRSPRKSPPPAEP